MQNEVEVSQELIPVERINVPDLFTNKNVAMILLQSIRIKALDFVPDVSTDKGRKAIASQAYKVAQSKTFLDGLGKQFLADLKAQTKSGDEIRRFIRDECDLIKKDTRKELDDWEKAEEDRIAKEKAEAEYMAAWDEAISENDLFDRKREIERKELLREKYVSTKNHIRDCRRGLIGGSPYPFAILLSELDTKLVIDDTYGEYADELKSDISEAIGFLKDEMHKQAERAEKEQAEREERIAKEAAERAKREAEEAAQRERERIEAEKKAAEERAAQAERDRIAAEERAKLEAQAAEQRRIEAEKKAEQARLKAIKDAEDRARAEAERKEAERIAKEAADRAEAERLARNKAHRKKINNAALASFEVNGIDRETAKKVISLIAKGLIDYVTINY